VERQSVLPPDGVGVEWVVYFPLLREVYTAIDEADAIDEAGGVGLVLGPYPKHRSKEQEERMAEKRDGRKTREMIGHMLLELETPVKTLTKWEEGFVMSVSDQFDSRGTLSDKQFEVLSKIYEDKSA
jgi:hypothetical protein